MGHHKGCVTVALVACLRHQPGVYLAHNSCAAKEYYGPFEVAKWPTAPNSTYKSIQEQDTEEMQQSRLEIASRSVGSEEVNLA